MGLKGKVVVITGGSGALGHTVTPACVSAGAHVVTVDRATPSHVAGGTALQADVTDEVAVQRVLREVIQKHGRLDVLINLVGGFAMGRLVDTEEALWQRMLAMNVTPAFVLSKAVIPQMGKQGAGRILHVAAWAAIEPFPGAAAYIIAKSSLVALIKVLALELKGSGVTVNGVLPTTIDTPANRANMPEVDPSNWTKPESIADTLVFLASDEAAQVSGATIPVGTSGGTKPREKS
jgi:NAD(P)-dependent dehydrogenase (short-subunit alcohol dehydrogenase family)